MSYGQNVRIHLRPPVKKADHTAIMGTFPKYDNNRVPTHGDSDVPNPPPYTRRFTALPTPHRFLRSVRFNSQAKTQGSNSGYDGKQLFLICKLFAISIFATAALALSIVVLIPQDDWYILQVDNSNIRAEVLFRNIILNQNFSATITQRYTVNDTDLAPYFRVGLMNWCEGDIVEDVWVKSRCYGWSSLDLGKFYAQSVGHVGTYNITSSDSSIVYLPTGYPSSTKIRRYSKNTKVITITATAFNVLTLLLALAGTILLYFTPDITFMCLAATVISCIIGVSLMSGVAYGPYYLAGNIITAFQDQISLFGVEVTRTAHIQLFAGLASGMVGGALLLSIIAVCIT